MALQRWYGCQQIPSHILPSVIFDKVDKKKGRILRPFFFYMGFSK